MSSLVRPVPDSGFDAGDDLDVLSETVVSIVEEQPSSIELLLEVNRGRGSETVVGGCVRT